MLESGPAKKVVIYLNEDARHHHAPLHEAVMQFLLHKRVAGATLTRASAGFGAGHVLHTPKVEALAEHLPLRIEFIESAARVEELLPDLRDMVRDGLIEVLDTTVFAPHSSPSAAAPVPRSLPVVAARMMRVYLGEGDRFDGEPLYEVIVRRLHLLDIAGATVHRGILGYGAKGHTHKRDFLHLSRDLPIMISVVDTPEKIEQAAAAVEDLMGDGLIVLSDVEMIRVLKS